DRAADQILPGGLGWRGAVTGSASSERRKPLAPKEISANLGNQGTSGAETEPRLSGSLGAKGAPQARVGGEGRLALALRQLFLLGLPEEALGALGEFVRCNIFLVRGYRPAIVRGILNPARTVAIKHVHRLHDRLAAGLDRLTIHAVGVGDVER